MNQFGSVIIHEKLKKKKKIQWNGMPNHRSYIPDFDVTSTVTLQKTSEEGIFRIDCSCNYTTVFGMPCVHSMVVAETFKPH